MGPENWSIKSSLEFHCSVIWPPWYQRFSKCAPWTSSISYIWELVRDADSQEPYLPPTHRAWLIQKPGTDPTMHVVINSPNILTLTGVWEPLRRVNRQPSLEFPVFKRLTLTAMRLRGRRLHHVLLGKLTLGFPLPVCLQVCFLLPIYLMGMCWT